MSTQPSTGQTPVLEGESGGPDYGGLRTSTTTSGGMLNGTGSGLQQPVTAEAVNVGMGEGTSFSAGAEGHANVEAVRQQQSSGPCAPTYGATGVVSEGSVASGLSSGLGASQQQQPIQPRQPQQPSQASQPQQPSQASQYQQSSQASQQQQLPQAQQPLQQSTVLQPRLRVPEAQTMTQTIEQEPGVVQSSQFPHQFQRKDL